MRTDLPTAADVTVLARGLRFPEGPVAEPDGSTLFVQIAAEVISRLRVDGGVEEVASVPGGPNGLARAGDRLVVCNNGGYFTWAEVGDLVVPGPTAEGWEGGSIDVVDPATGDRHVLYDAVAGERLQAPNDLVLDGEGGFWFTDHGVRQEAGSTNAHRPGVCHAALDGTVIVGAAGGLDAPNGVGLSPDGRTLYVAETHTGRLWSWPVEGPGRLGADPAAAADHGGRLLHDAPEGRLFDSLAVDAEGRVVVGTLGSGHGGLTVVEPDSGEATHIPLDDPLVTNVCFGGPDGRTATCTGSGQGTIFTLPWPCPGVGLHR